MKLVDIENQRIVLKSAVLQFFTLSNFLDIIVVEEEIAAP